MADKHNQESKETEAQEETKTAEDSSEKGQISLRRLREDRQQAQREEELAARRTESEIKEAEMARILEERQREEEHPKSEGKKKMENFFYHYRVALIIGGFVVLFAVFLVRDIFFATKPDMVVIAAGSLGLPTELTEELVDRLAPVVGDVNGDGKESITFDAILMPSSDAFDEPADIDPEQTQQPNMSDPQMEAAGMMKLMAVVSSGQDHLFFMDKDAVRYITQGGTAADLFEPLQLHGKEVYGIPLSETILSDVPYAEYLEEYQFYVRVPMNPEKVEPDHEEALRVLEELIKEQ